MEKRYINLLKSILINEVYLENDARLLYIYSCIASGGDLDQNIIRNISTEREDLVNSVRAARQVGGPWWRVPFTNAQGETQMLNFRNISEFSHTMIGRERLNNIEHCLDEIRRDGIDGDVAETGVWRGGAGILMKGYLTAYGMSDKKVWLADSFEGLPVPTLPQDEGWDFSPSKVPILAISQEEVEENFRRYDLLDDGVMFVKGWFRDTLHLAPIDRLSLLRLDGDLYESTMDALNALYQKLVPGGFLIVDDYSEFEPCRRAIHEFREHHEITDPIQKIDWAGVYWRKTG